MCINDAVCENMNFIGFLLLKERHGFLNDFEVLIVFFVCAKRCSGPNNFEKV